MDIWGIIHLRSLDGGRAGRAGHLDEVRLADRAWLRIRWITDGQETTEILVPPDDLVRAEVLTEEQARRAGRPGIPVQEVVSAVAGLTAVTAGRIMGRSRQASVALARFLVYRALRNRGLTLTEIGAAVGRDHGAVSSGLATLKETAKTNPTIREWMAWVNERFPMTEAA